MQPSQGPPIIHIHPPTIPDDEITQISHEAQTTMINQGPNSPTISKIRPVKILHPLSNIHK